MVKYAGYICLMLVFCVDNMAFAEDGLRSRNDTCHVTLVADTVKTESIQAADTVQNTADQYKEGFKDGFQNYQPNAERIVGLSVLLLPMFALPGCIYYSFKKVSQSNIVDSRYQTNPNVNYRSGYVAGASKRRRVAAWSCFGGAVGVFAGAGAALGLLLAAGNGQ